jgi:hypothetical protein
MAIVLEGCITEEQSSVLRFLVRKKVNAKNTHTEMFPDYGEKCFSRKAVHTWSRNVENFSMMTKSLKRGFRSG